jgi:hypothetical protein
VSKRTALGAAAGDDADGLGLGDGERSARGALVHDVTIKAAARRPSGRRERIPVTMVAAARFSRVRPVRSFHV